MSTLDCDGIHRSGLAGIMDHHSISSGLPSIDKTILQERVRGTAGQTPRIVTHRASCCQGLLYKPLYSRNSLSTTPIQRLRCSLPLAAFTAPTALPEPGPDTTGVRGRLFNNQSQPTIGQSPRPFQLNHILSSHDTWKADFSPCGDRLTPLANFLNGCAPHNNSVSGTLR
jgi:hypothetical protein